MFPSFKYATKIWITSVLATPVLLLFWLFFTKDQVVTNGIVPFLFLSMLIGAIFSIPNWLLLILGTSFIFKLDISDNKKRILTSVLSILLCFGLFLVIFGRDDPITWSESLYVFAPCYSISLVASSWIYRL